MVDIIHLIVMENVYNIKSYKFYISIINEQFGNITIITLSVSISSGSSSLPINKKDTEIQL
jgi:hypothetical protein